MDLLEIQANDLRYLTQDNQDLSSLAGQSPSAAGGPAASPTHRRLNNPMTRRDSAHGDNSAPRPSYDAHSLTGAGVASAGSKRKAEAHESPPGLKQQRSKRNRYTSIACNECKRRKIKCNGETPCQRCGNLGLSCVYAANCCSTGFRDSDEFRDMTDHITRLQEQVDALYSSVNSLRQETLRLAPIQSQSDGASASSNRRRILPPPIPMPGHLPQRPSSSTFTPSPSTSSMPSLPRLHSQQPDAPRVMPSFSGPTSMLFTVDVAKSTLHNMGYSGPGEATEDTTMPVSADTPQTVEQSPRLLPQASGQSRQILTQDEAEGELSITRQTADPLWEFDGLEMVRLCRLHEDEVGIMYPVVKIENIIEHAQDLAGRMANIEKRQLEQTRSGPALGKDNEYDLDLTDIDTLQLKIIMCCALAVAEHGNSERAARLYASIQPIVDRKLMTDPPTVADLPFLALVAGYRFLSNDEILAWRVMGQVARLCLEMGLHRREGLAKIVDAQDRRNARNTFWSAYVLDRRWAFGTGLPYVVRDDNIDPKLEYPEEFPYLCAMITYSMLAAKIWKLVDYFEPAIILELKREDFEELDGEIWAWYDSVPAEIKLSALDKERPLPNAQTYNLQRLQIWTRLRLNQIRIWLHTPVLHSASSIAENMPLAQRAVDLARDTIQYLARLNATTDLYRRIQIFYHQFLTSAIAVLFLASTHAPLQFSSECRNEFYMALDLVKDLSSRSWVSQRLWRTVRSLKAYAPPLGLLADEERDVGRIEGIRYSDAGIGGVAGLSIGHSGRTSTTGPKTQSSTSSNSFASNHTLSQHTDAHGSQYPTPKASLPKSPGNTADRPHRSQKKHDDNGLRLHSEMSRVFEDFMTGQRPAGAQDSRHEQTKAPIAFGSDVDLFNGGSRRSSAMQAGARADGGLFMRVREMF